MARPEPGTLNFLSLAVPSLILPPMTRGETMANSPIISGIAGRESPCALAVILTATLALSACGERSGPPAPIIDRTGIYYTAPAGPLPPVSAAPRGRVTRAPVASETAAASVPTSRTSRRAVVTSAPLAPPPNAPQPPPAARTVTQAATQPAVLPSAGTLIKNKGGVTSVRAGETLYAISRREKIPLRALIDANRLKPPYALRVGQKIRLPAVRLYIVAPGDTVYGVARRHDAGISDVIRENDLKAPDFGLYAGQRLVLPWQGKDAAKAPSARPTQTVESTPQIRNAAKVKLPVAEFGDPNAPPPRRAGRKFLWPVQGKVVSGFGAKGGGLYNDGINISAKGGAFVRAAENGIVAYSGNELRGYGNLLLVRHSGGWVSAYAHNGEMLVRRGQVVKRGQPIARVGRSGAVARPQLHFELRRGRKAVDPRPHLS